MDSGLLAQEQPQEGFEKSLSPFLGVVNELEEAEVEEGALARGHGEAEARSATRTRSPRWC